MTQFLSGNVHTQRLKTIKYSSTLLALPGHTYTSVTNYPPSLFNRCTEVRVTQSAMCKKVNAGRSIRVLLHPLSWRLTVKLSREAHIHLARLSTYFRKVAHWCMQINLFCIDRILIQFSSPSRHKYQSHI